MGPVSFLGGTGCYGNKAGSEAEAWPLYSLLQGAKAETLTPASGQPCLDSLKTLLIPKGQRSRDPAEYSRPRHLLLPRSTCHPSPPPGPGSSHSAQLQSLPRGTPPLGSQRLLHATLPRDRAARHQPLQDLHTRPGRTLVSVNVAQAPVKGQALWISPPAGCPARTHVDRPSALVPLAAGPSPWKGRPGVWLTSWRKWRRCGRRTSEQLW